MTDSAALLALLIKIRAQGISSILISHRPGEVSRVADRIAVDVTEAWKYGIRALAHCNRPAEKPYLFTRLETIDEFALGAVVQEPSDRCIRRRYKSI